MISQSTYLSNGSPYTVEKMVKNGVLCIRNAVFVIEKYEIDEDKC